MILVSHLKVLRYRQMENVEVDLSDMTVLVGPNGSGKSTLLCALDFALNGELADEMQLAARNPGLLNALIAPGVPEVEFTLRLPRNQISRQAKNLNIPSPDLLIENGMTYRRRFDGAKNNKAIVTTEPQFELPGPKNAKAGEIKHSFMDWAVRTGKGHSRIVHAERPYHLDRNQGKSAKAASPSALIQGIARSDYDREGATDDRFERLKRCLGLLFPEFDSYKGIEIGGTSDIEFGGVLSNFVGTGHREVAYLFASLVDAANRLVAIEEPERSVHPGILRNLMRVIRDEFPDKQLLISTHSPTIVSIIPAECVWACSEGTRVERLKPEGAADLARTLGIRPGDILDQNVVLFVEGESDRDCWEEWLRQAGMDQKCAVVAMEGYGSIKYYANNELVRQRTVTPKVCTALDGDVKMKDDYKYAKEDAEKAANATGGTAFDLTENTLEDYFLAPGPLASTYGRTEEAIIALIAELRNEYKEKERGQVEAKWVLNNLLFELRGKGYSETRDAGVLAREIKEPHWHEDIKRVVESIKSLLS